MRTEDGGGRGGGESVVDVLLGSVVESITFTSCFFVVELVPLGEKRGRRASFPPPPRASERREGAGGSAATTCARRCVQAGRCCQVCFAG